MFDGNSVVVKIWVKQVREGRFTLDQIPGISNLKEIVAGCIMAEAGGKE